MAGNETAPENSIAAIEEAIEAGAVAVELDVRRSSDGSLFLMHDKTLDRTTMGSGPIAKTGSADLNSLRLRNAAGDRTDETVPTLAAALDVARGRILVMIDSKIDQPEDVEDIAALVPGARDGRSDHRLRLQ